MQVSKLHQEILSHISDVESRIVYGVGVPKNLHAAVIGRGGALVTEIQSKHSVKIVFPNWNDVSSNAVCVNANELGDVSSDDLIRILGSLESCKAAAEDIKVSGFTGLFECLQLFFTVSSCTALTRKSEEGTCSSQFC